LQGRPKGHRRNLDINNAPKHRRLASSKPGIDQVDDRLRRAGQAALRVHAFEVELNADLRHY